MYRNKKDVDKHVENLRSKLSVKEFNTRAYSVARLYFDVGDYSSCQKYVEQYLTQKDNNAAAYRLLGQTLQKLGQKEKALDSYKTSFDIDPTQTNTILDICELLADDHIKFEPIVAQKWCKKAEDTFPKHQITFRLREKMITHSNPDPEALVKLLLGELAVRPRDSSLHARLLKHYININNLKEAFKHSINIEFSNDNFMNDYVWYEILDDLLKHYLDHKDWLYQLLLLTVKERLCVLSLIESLNGTPRSLVESNELIHAYDQALEKISQAGAAPRFAEFHASLLQHHRGQFAFHAATLLLKKAKKDQLSWREANRVAAPLMLIAWQTVPLDSKVSWLKHSSDKLLNAVDRWYMEGTYRCSQSGHYLLSNFQDKSSSFLGQISQSCSGSHWKDKLYEKVFTNRNQLARITTSYMVSNAFNAPVLQFPRNTDVEAFDSDAQKLNGNSLHHFVWTIMNYKNFAHFKCGLFDMLTPTISTCGPETLDKLDIHAFLYCAALTAQQQKSNEVSHVSSDKPNTLPANITDLLCTPSQMKWWDCAYKFSQNILGVELTDIRATLGHGIEVVRCVDNHGLDLELLCLLGRIFNELAKATTSMEEKVCLEKRAALYYRSAIPLLEKLNCKLMIKVSPRRMFDYTHKALSEHEVNMLIEETKMYIAVSYIKEGEYDKAIDYLVNIKSALAYYHLTQTYTKIAADFDEEITSPFEGSKHAALLAKAKSYAYKALDMLKGSKTNNSLYIDVQEIIEEIEVKINKMDSELCSTVNERKLSDENISYNSESIRPVKLFQNLSSTPKASSNTTNYKSAIDSQQFEMTRMDQKRLETIENEIKDLQKRDVAISDYISQTRTLFEENRKLSNQIINSINSNSQNATDQFKLLKISVDDVKGQTDECRNDVGELKKQIADLKMEVNKLKISSSEQAINDNDMYNIDDNYRSNENSANYVPQLPFPTHVQFSQRPPFPVPPNPYQLYNQSLYNLYNQYSQFAQATPVPGAPPIFDSSRGHMNYPGVYPTPDQMYLDVAHIIQPNLPVPPIPVVSNLSTMPIAPTSHQTVPTIPSVSNATLPNLPKAGAGTKTSTLADKKIIPQSLPANVVITSSDPLPTCVSAPTPVLSVTIPPKHIKNTPHNYQIAMPTVYGNKIVSPPVFSFSMPDNKHQSSTTDWKPTFQSFNTEESIMYKPMHDNSLPDTSKTVVDGVFSRNKTPNTSPNKSRTLSEKSNTSIENYDPCPDFKPIVPLPAEITVTTGEENEESIFSARAKLFRYVDKQWKERGIGEIKLLKHNTTGKVRVLMRREQVHKICANHIITPEMDIQPMKNETKAYFWVANDFADETLVLEKFCARFKTADIAKDFYDMFKKSSLESKSTDNDAPLTSKIEKEDISHSKQSIQSETNIIAKEVAQPMLLNKTVVGGFTFSSAPIFKSVQNDNDTKTTQNSPIQKDTNSPFSNIFSRLTTNAPTPNVSVENQDTLKSMINTSDTVEEFEPNVEFKPVIPLPALVDTKTGEEDEIVIFEHRAKLLRFDSNTKEWKERGLGNIKVLVHKNNNQKIRLLMRREQIMKLCCNHAITKEMAFQKMPNIDKAVTWCAKDFSDGELVTETFCVRFKTVKTCDDFMEAIKTVQSKLKDDIKAAKDEQNAAKQVNQSGFGDNFKAKPGSWYCDTCYTNNLESFEKCACCCQLKPPSQSPGQGDNALNVKTTGTTASSWGDQFKSKPGSWECQSCFIRNDAQLENCSACDSPKDAKAMKTITTTIIETKSNFNFGIPSQTADTISNQLMDTSNKKTTLFSESGFGDKFKPKEGSWECKQCFVRNENVEKCMACQCAKDSNVKSNTNTSDSFSTSSVKFRFGIPPTQVNEEKPSTGSTSMFDGLGAHKFSFGIPPAPVGGKFDVDTDQKPTAAIFAAPKLSSEDQNPLNFSLKKSEENKNPSATKSALLPTPQTKSSSFASKETGTFDFVFKPTVSAKSPAKSPNKSQADDSDGEEYVKDEDCHAYFSPVIPMPEKVEVITGEENEIELYTHRARLFIFVSGEWKERGTGIVRVLKHKDTHKLRVVMRREQVLKICLNHALTQDIIYTPKDEKTWLFAANDFSEGELSLHQFCIRFQNKDVALSFKEAVDTARQDKPVSQVDKADTNEKDDDVIFVSQTQATAQEKKKANELMLPENFYTYNNKEPCKGCRGCRDDDEMKPETTSIDAIKAILSAPALTVTKMTASNSTPMKTISPQFQSPINSIYGTPRNSDKTSLDTSIFRTPLGSIASNANSSTSSNNNDITINDATNKENFSTPKNTMNIFSNYGEVKASSTAINSPSTVFGGGDSHSATATKTLIAPPKQNTFNTQVPGDTKVSDAKSVFASAQVKFGTPSATAETKSMFSNTGTSANTSIFGFNTDQPKQESNAEVRSIFGSNDQKPLNLFSGGAGSLFGPNNSGNKTPSIFSPEISSSSSSGAAPTNVFQSIFSNNANNVPTSVWNISSQQQPASIFNKTVKSQASEAEKETKVGEITLKVDNALSFAALSSSEPGFQKKDNFQWEGTGQQLFSSGKKDSRGEGAEAADDEYDPHYEPIVPLPEKIVVTTGEEDEEKIFGERGQLFRYNENEWKERGVGEMKILHHPQRNTYRLLLRREQIHKAVLNMLIFMDMELLPMKNTERAWTWVARNFAESADGEQEALAVRFKTQALADAFRDKVVECTRKLQAAAAQAIRDQQEAKNVAPAEVVQPLRLPKHLSGDARADAGTMATAAGSMQSDTGPSQSESGPMLSGAGSSQSDTGPMLSGAGPMLSGAGPIMSAANADPTDTKQVTFQEYNYQEEQEEQEHDDQYDPYDYNAYYEEEEDENEAYYACEGEAVVRAGGGQSTCPQAHIQLLFDHDTCTPRILVTDSNTGEILADMLVDSDTDFQMEGESCTWSGVDYTTSEPADKTVTVNFYDSEAAAQFHESCVTTKPTSTYSPDDPES